MSVAVKTGAANGVKTIREIASERATSEVRQAGDPRIEKCIEMVNPAQKRVLVPSRGIGAGFAIAASGTVKAPGCGRIL